MAARKTLWTPEIVRQRIRVSQLINVLQKQALTGSEMPASQLKAIEILLRKALPDLTAVTHSGSIERKAHELSDEQLADIAAGRRAGTVEAPISEEIPGEIH